MKKLSLVVLVLGSMLMAACSKSGNSTPVAACGANGVYNPYGQQNPYGSQYPYGVPGSTGCAGIPYGQAGAYGYGNGAYGYGGAGYGAQAYGGNPCAVYNNGYQTWSVG